jgi:hypothetical protein
MDAVPALSFEVEDVVWGQRPLDRVIDQTIELAGGQGGKHWGVGEGIHRTSKLLGCAVLLAT